MNLHKTFCNVTEPTAHNLASAIEWLCLKGWLLLGKDDTCKYTYVVVRLDSGHNYSTCIMKIYVKLYHLPRHDVDAALEQHSNIDPKL